MPLLPDALPGLLANVVSGFIGWVARSTLANRLAPADHERAITAWLDSYELATGLIDDCPLPELVSESQAKAWLYSAAVQAVLYELITVELTNAPQPQLGRVRSNLEYSCLEAFPQAEEDSVARFSECVFLAAHREMQELLANLEERKPDFLIQVRQQAFTGRIAAILEALERHTSGLAELTPADRIRDRQFLSLYRKVAANEHGYLQLPDFERRRQIPIEKIYVAPDITAETTEDRKQRTPTSTSIWNFINYIDRAVLLGDPGGGKSTAVSVLVNRLSLKGDEARVPLVVILREYAKEMPPATSIIGYLENRMKVHYQCTPPAGLIERVLLTGNCVVFFDGLDELIDTSRRREVSQIVENFCMRYPLTPILVTSRRIGYEQARLDVGQFVSYAIAPFTSKQSEQYAANWFDQDRRLSEREPEEWAASFMRESEAIADLRSNPLMLALLCILYRGQGSLPRNRPAVYERCATLLFETWDSSRNIIVNPRARDLIEPVLRHLAYWLMKNSSASVAVSEMQLIDETTRYLKQRSFEDVVEAKKVAQEFVDFCKGRAWVFSEVGTSGEGEPLFTFTHRTFLEYFAAAYIASICDSPNRLAAKLAGRIAREEWDVVAQLAVQIKARQIEDGGAKFYAAVLSSKRYSSAQSVGNTLSFLARCLRFIDVPPGVVRELTDRCLTYLLLNPEFSPNIVPLGALMSIDRLRNIVTSRLSDQIGRIVTDHSVAEKIKGLHLISGMSVPLRIPETFGDREQSIEQREYWHNFGQELCQIYRQVILEFVESDNSLLLRAYMLGWVRLKELPGWPHRALELLLNAEIRVGIGTSWWIDPASQLLNAFMRGKEEDGAIAANLEEIPELVKNLGDPPWKATLSRGKGGFLHEVEGSAPRTEYSEAAWSGVCLLTAMLFEHGREGLIEGDRPKEESYGALRPMFPYLDRRSGHRPRGEFKDGSRRKALSDLDPLQVDPLSQALLTEWAERRVSLFMSPSHRQK